MGEFATAMVLTKKKENPSCIESTLSDIRENMYSPTLLNVFDEEEDKEIMYFVVAFKRKWSCICFDRDPKWVPIYTTLYTIHKVIEDVMLQNQKYIDKRRKVKVFCWKENLYYQSSRIGRRRWPTEEELVTPRKKPKRSNTIQ